MERQISLTPVADDHWKQITLETTTCWDLPYQSPKGRTFGNSGYRGCTPALVIWNLLKRYTHPGDLVIDCMAGGGTTLDVARALGRKVIGLDISPSRSDIAKNDARRLPFANNSVDFHFIDSPYSDNLRYSYDDRCLGRIPAISEQFYIEIEKVVKEIHRTLKSGRYAAWVISDEYKHGIFSAVGFRLFSILDRYFVPIDIIALIRHNDSGINPMWEHIARKRNFFLRGFKYLFIVRKESGESRVD